ncbi:adenylylsulfatase HINT3-like isoform X1 [Zingiber officinale]|uniref:adenylylsulfatase HINT3-like isoform X1 n=1 Tax=Zingiber officinale TaxID=94328 RepID=UPI001C4BCEB0|nr:adenylylsulfatase HINT3-like isoform X1 [Zingiber officinale]
MRRQSAGARYPPLISSMAQRRLSDLSSHLHLPGPASASHSPPPRPCGSTCSATSSCEAEADAEAELGGEKGCVFCRIVRGESPAFMLYEDDVCMCILDSNPLTFGHSLIIPKSHTPSLEATPPAVVAAMCSKIPILSNCIRKATQSDSFNLLVNNGSAAGQVIFHTHFHIIPRKAGDKLWPSEPFYTYNMQSFRRQPLESNQEIVDLVNTVRDLVSSQA